MPAATLDLIDSRVIEANSRWTFDIILPGNQSRTRARGQIRRAPGEELLANFRVTPSVYDGEANQTRIRLSLSAKDTEKIPVTEPDQFWVYDVLLQGQDGDFERILKGKVRVDAGVTDV